MSHDWKMAVIGGGSKIVGAALCDLAQRAMPGFGKVVLVGRTRRNTEDNIRLLNLVCPENTSFETEICDDAKEAVKNADIVYFNATGNLDEYEGKRSIGIPQGAHILHVAGLIEKYAPDAWLLVNTNPTDIPLGAVKKMYGNDRVLGCCNAPLITKKMIHAFFTNCLGRSTKEKDIRLYEIGLNHDLWFYDCFEGSEDIYELLRQTLPVKYDENKMRSEYSDAFPEWKYAFKNNIFLMEKTGYLSCPVGGSRRYENLPVSGEETGKRMKRPTRDDFREVLEKNASKEEIVKVISRCGGGIPEYMADLLEALILGQDRECSAQIVNNGSIPQFPDEVLIQMTLKFGKMEVKKPETKSVPDFIKGALATRAYQNDMISSALAGQDAGLMEKALYMLPESLGKKPAIFY